MDTTAKVISGVVGLLLASTAPVSYVGYTTWDKNNPTGEAWLLSSGYTSNKPTFKSQDHLRHGCSENLFSNDKKEADPTKDSKLYGCAVMSMDLGHTGVKFTNLTKDPKYIKFNSEVAIRKGDEGWIINSRVDNWSDWSTLFNYILTSYKYRNNQWTKEGESKLWKDQAAQAGTITPLNKYDLNDTESSGIEGSINMYQKKLVIKTPQSYWWNSDEWVAPSGDAKTKTKKHLWTNRWSGAWIHDETENSWIFQDIELFVGEKKYSQVFCEGGDGCFQKGDGMPEKTNRTDKLDTWQNAYRDSKENYKEKVEDMVKKDIPPIIQKLKGLKGKWVDLEEVCGVTKNRNLSEDQKNKLKMFCVNKKN